MSRVNIASLNINITASSTGLQTQVNQAVNAVRSLNQGVQRQNEGLRRSFAEIDKIILRSIAIYSIFRTANFAKDQLFDSVKLAADAEKSRIAFEVLLGSAEEASKVIADLYEFVETTPFSLVEVRDATQLLIGAGIESKKLMPTLRALGDVAAGSGKPFGELAFLYATARTEQRLYTKDLNQFLSANVPLIPVFAKQFGIAEASVRKLAEEGKLSFDDLERAIASLTAAGGRFAGLTQRQQDSAAGQYEKLLDTITQLKTEFGFGLNPVLRETTIAIQELITEGDKGVSTLEGFRNAGVLLGEALRITGAVIQFVRASAISLEVAAIRLVKVFALISDAVAGTSVNELLSLTEDTLNKQAAKLFASASKLADLSKRLTDEINVTSAQSTGTLADSIGAVGDSATRSRNQLKFLQQDMEKFADTVKESLLTPVQLFEKELKNLIQANLLGFLSDAEFNLALADQVEKLNTATQRLNSTMNEGSSFNRGTKESEDLILKIRNQATQKDQPNDVAKIVADLRAQVQRELDLMEAQTQEVAENTQAVRDLTDELRNQPSQPGSGDEGIVYPSNPRAEVSVSDVARAVGNQFRDWLRSFGPSESSREGAQGLLDRVREGVDALSVDNTTFPAGKPGAPLSPDFAAEQAKKLAEENAKSVALFEENNRKYAAAAEEEKRANERKLALIDEEIRERTGDSSVSGPTLDQTNEPKLASLDDEIRKLSVAVSRLNTTGDSSVSGPTPEGSFKEIEDGQVESRREFDKVMAEQAAARREIMNRQTEASGRGFNPDGRQEPAAAEVAKPVSEAMQAQLDRLRELFKGFADGGIDLKTGEKFANPNAAAKAAFAELRDELDGKDAIGNKVGERTPIEPGLFKEFMETLNRESGETADAKPSPVDAASDEAARTATQLAELMKILRQSYSSSEIVDSRFPAEMMAESAMKFFTEDRQGVKDAGFPVDKQAPQLYNKLLEEIEKARDRSGKSQADSPTEGGKPGAPGGDKVASTITSNAILDRAKFDRIITAVEKTAGQPQIVVQTYAA